MAKKIQKKSGNSKPIQMKQGKMPLNPKYANATVCGY